MRRANWYGGPGPSRNCWRSWYGPNVETIIPRFELKPGGAWLCEMRFGGKSHYQRGDFTEVAAPKRLVWLHSNTDAEWTVAPSPMMPNWPLVLLASVTLEEAGGGTTMRLTWVPLRGERGGGGRVRRCPGAAWTRAGARAWSCSERNCWPNCRRRTRKRLPVPMTHRKTGVAIDGETWLINGAPTYRGREYRGRAIEGLLLNSRMANAVFDDANPATRFLWRYPDTGRWDAGRNTDEFVDALPLYREHGLAAVTVNLQGGSPFGYYREDRFRQLLADRRVAYTDAEVWRGLPGPASQPWHNSPFAADGALAREAGHLERLSRILWRADELGMVVVLGIFYFGQDERLRDEAAVRRAVEETCGWLLQEGWRNVVIEVNNECDVPRYEHEILQPHRVHELIALARRVTHGGDRLLVGTSYGGGSIPGDAVCAASDFILLHGNGVTEPDRIAAMVDRTRALPAYAGQPIAFTEDDHFAFDRPHNNFTAALSRRAGWGLLRSRSRRRRRAVSTATTPTASRTCR